MNCGLNIVYRARDPQRIRTGLALARDLKLELGTLTIGELPQRT